MIVKIGSSPRRMFVGQCGIKQGCPCAPILFSIIMNSLVVRLDSGTALQIPDISTEDYQEHFKGKRIRALLYADDVVLLGNSYAAAKQLLQDTSDWSREQGLILNPSKSCSMIFKRNHKIHYDNFVISGTEIENVSHFKYLGNEINEACSLTRMAQTSLSKGNQALVWMKKYLYTTWHGSFETRKNVCRSVFEGIVMYASELWLQSDQAVQKMRMLYGKLGCMLWGSPINSNRTVNYLETGLMDPALNNLFKRIRLTDKLRVGHSPAALLFATCNARSLMKRILDTQELEIDEDTRKAIILRKLTPTVQAELTRSLLEDTLESTTSYLQTFYSSIRFGRGAEREFSKGYRLAHQLRMDSFYSWRRLCWANKWNIGTYCGWCKCEGIDESREHLIINCECWSQPRQLFLKDIIKKVRQAGISNEREIANCILGDKSRLKLAFDEEEKVLRFLQVVAVSKTRVLQMLK